MAGIRRRLAIGLVLVVGVALVLLGCSWLVVRVWGPSLTASRIATAITDATGEPSTVRAVALEPLHGRVRISDLTVGHPDQPLFRIERIDVAIRIESLWRRELVVGVAVAGADVRVQPGPAPAEPMAFDLPESFQLGPITARLGSIVVERSRLTFEDSPQGVAIALEGLAATGQPKAGGLEVTARAGLMDLRVADFRQRLERLRADGRIDAARIRVRRLEIDDPRHEITVTGSIEAPWTRQPMLAGEAKVRVAVGPIARGLGASLPIEGTVAADLALSGALAAPVLAGSLHAERLDAAGLEARNLSGTLRLDEQAFTLSDVEGRVLGGRLRSSLTIPSGRPHETVVRLQLDGADADALARLRGPGPDVHGRLTLDADARGDLAQPMSLSGQLRVEGSALSLPGALGRLGVGRVQATARMAGGRVIADAEGRWPSASLTASATVEPDRRLRVEARTRTDLSVLPGWARGDSVAIAARAEGPWPRTAFTASVDLARSAARRDPGRVDIRLDPVPGGEPRWSGVLRSRSLGLPWAEVADVQSTLALSDAALDVVGFSARVAGVPVDGAGRWTWRGAGDAKLVVGPAALAQLPGIPRDLALDGSARAQVEVTLSPAGMQGTARLEAERVAVAKVVLGHGTGEAGIKDRQLEATLRFPERQLELSARGDLGPGQMIASRVTLRSFDLASLAAPPRGGKAPVVRGVISASAELAIPIDSPGDLRGRLTLDPMTIGVATTQWSSGAPIVAHLADRRATLAPLRLTGPAGTISVGGVLWEEGARPSLQARLDRGRLSALAPELGVDGRVRVEAELSGDSGAVAGTQGRVRAVGDGLVLPGALAAVGNGTSRVDLQFAEGVIGIARGEVSFPGLTGRLTGRIHLDGGVALDARATAQAGPLGTAFGLSDADGTVTATATLGGRLSQPDGQARIAAERLVLAGIAAERIDAAARLRGETVRLERLTARVLGAPLRASGEWTLSGTGRAELEAGPLALAQIPAPERLALGGALSLRATATADRGTLQAQARVQATETRAAGLTLGAGSLTARVDGRRLEVNLDLAARRITGSASGTLGPGGAIDATLDVSALELAPLLRHLTAQEDIGVEATATGRFTARAEWDRPSALTARAQFEPIVLRSRHTGLDGHGQVEARWENGTLELERADFGGNAGTLRATGTVDHAGNLDVRLDARLSLAALTAFVPAITDSQGTVALQAHVTGALAEPSIQGETSLTDGRIALRGFPEPLRDINGRVVATPGGIRLVDASAVLSGGSLRATGEAALAGRTLGLYRIRITARDVPLRPLEGLDTVWDADLDLGGTKGRSLLSGEARLVRGHYGRDLVSLSALTAPEQAAAATSEVGLPLSIRVLLEDNFVVRTSQARMRVGGRLTVRGTTAAPIVLGVIEAREGTLILRGHRYELERAVVRFADPRRIDPLLDVTATTRIQDYDVTMRLTGHIRDLDMRLTSSPTLPREQLLSLVAFGTTGGETGRGASGAFAGEAAALVVRELFDSSGTEDTLPEPLRAIIERTRVSLTHSSAEVGRFGLRVEYEVTGPFLLAGERTSEGYYVIDGVVRLRFR